MSLLYFSLILFNAWVLTRIILWGSRSLEKYLNPAIEYEVLGIALLYDQRSGELLRILFPGERFTEADDLEVMVLFASQEEIRGFPQAQLSVYILDWMLCYKDTPIRVIKREIPLGLRYQVFPLNFSYQYFPDREICRKAILASGTEREQILLELVIAWQNFIESKTGVRHMLA